MQNKKKFYQTNWFLILVSLFFPIIGLVLLWTCHKQKRIVLKIILSILLLLWSFSEITIEKPVETLHQENIVVEEQHNNENTKEINDIESEEVKKAEGQINIEENITEDMEEINIKTDESVEINKKMNLLLNLNYQEIPMMNGAKTQRIGTVLRFLGDNLLFGQSSVEELKEFFVTKVDPIKKDYNYVVIDFLSSDNGLIYRYGIIEYGKLHKENKDFYFENENDI